MEINLQEAFCGYIDKEFATNLLSISSNAMIRCRYNLDELLDKNKEVAECVKAEQFWDDIADQCEAYLRNR